MSCPIIPCDDNLLVRPRKAGTLASGLTLPDQVNAQQNQRIGVVLATGPGKHATPDDCCTFGLTNANAGPDGVIRIPMRARVGMTVMYHRALDISSPLFDNGAPLFIVRDSDVVAMVDGLPDDPPSGPGIPNIFIPNGAMTMKLNSGKALGLVG